MANANDLLRLVKTAAIDAVNAQVPMGIAYGTVTSINPLSVRLDAKLILQQSQLEVVKSLSDYEIYLQIEGGQREKYTIFNSLKVDDKVAMLRFEGGRRFLVIDRV